MRESTSDTSELAKNMNEHQAGSNYSVSFGVINVSGSQKCLTLSPDDLF